MVPMIFGDVWGKTKPELTVTLSPNNVSVNNIVFEESSKAFVGHFRSTSVGSINSLASVSVSPNPVTDFVSVSGLARIQGNKTIVLSSVTGAEISRQTIMADKGNVSTAAGAAGVYLLQVCTDAGNATFRITK